MVTGTLLDCLDLYVYCRMNDISLHLSLLNLNNKALEIIRILHSLYDERGYDNYFSKKILNDIKVVTKVDILSMRKVVFFDYASLKECIPFLKSSSVIFVSNLLMNEDVSLIHSLKRINIKTIVESKYNFFVEEEYRQKILVPIVDERKENALVVCPCISFEDIPTYHQVTLPENVLFRNGSTYNNLWGNFDRLIYLQSPVVYDRKPRILYECYKCNIPIEYHRYEDKIDGSFFRYGDYEDREYTKDDYLIEWIKNE